MNGGWPAALAHQIGPGVTHSESRADGIIVNLPCTKCPKTVDFHIGRRLPPEVVNRKLIATGWRTGRKLTCPSCMEKETKKVAQQIDPKPTPAVAAIVPAVTPAPSNDARKAHRAIMGWLETAYNEEKRGYEPDWSDAKIATETGAAVEYVAKVREEYFGPIERPVALEVILAKTAELDRMTRGALGEAASLTKVIEDIRKRVAEVETEIARLTRVNGWKR